MGIWFHRTLVAFAGLLVATVANAVTDSKRSGPVPDFETAVRSIVTDRALREAQVAIAILDVDSGQMLASHNEHLLLNPASNAKLFTAAAALSILRPEHRYETALYGVVRDGVVNGPLLLRGYGDPSLSSSDLWSLVQDLRARNIRRVEGDIVVDQRFFDDSFVPPAFEQQPHEWAAFRAPVSAVAINENTVTLAVRPGPVGGPAFVAFEPPGFVDVEGTVTTVDSGIDAVGLSLMPSGKRLQAKVSGTIGADSRLVRYTRRVEDPTLLAGYVLRNLLDQAGIKVAGDVKLGGGKGGSLLARHESEPLGNLMGRLGKASDNFYAEMVFKSLGGEVRGRPAKSENAAAVVQKWLEKVGASDAGVAIRNGSGLFDANRVTAFSTVQLLRVAWRDPGIQHEFLSQLAVGGVDGTLHRRFRSEKTRRAVRAKTGTLEDAVALSGYVLGPAGAGTVAFSILFNKVAGKTAGARAAADELVEVVARRSWGR